MAARGAREPAQPRRTLPRSTSSRAGVGIPIADEVRLRRRILLAGATASRASAGANTLALQLALARLPIAGGAPEPRAAIETSAQGISRVRS
jgi:hypothetical protein